MKLNRLISVCASLLWLATAGWADRPNVLFVLTEDQGAHMSLLDTPGLKTPHMDQIARQGVYFNQAFVAYPVCSASKGSIYTGLHCHTHGILNNTHNYHKPASQVTAEEHGRQLAKTNKIRDQFQTLTEILKSNGYYQGVTHKLHVLPNRKFPYDEFMGGNKAELARFIGNAKAKDQPWFLMVNIPYSHRPYPNSDKTPIRVQPSEVELPSYLIDSPPIRKDWSEYLAGVEKADKITGEAMEVLKASGQQDNTIVIFMSDHGPTFQHGKMTLYDLGLRVPLAISGPGIRSGVRSDALASEIDLLPTLVDLCDLETNIDYPIHGKSLAGLITSDSNDEASQDKDSDRNQYIFAEISNRGPLPNDGMQERCVYDGRWKLIYREKVETGWRQVNADTRDWKPWGNRTYAETIRLKDKFPREYQVLAETDPQNLGAKVPVAELYDLQSDPDEMNNLITSPDTVAKRKELAQALRDWKERTDDSSMSLSQLSEVTQP